MELNHSNTHALVHSIETFGTVDGPGIRFVVFLQGCMLKCKYCHNRDSWELNSGTVKDLEELVSQVKRYKSYLIPSHGGVTVSGGEPLLQAEFVAAFFKRLKENGFHTALDTAGSIKITPTIEDLLSYTDLVLLDVKQIDNEKCISLTGSSNKNTLDFARFLAAKKIPVWIRQVIVPGLTDDEKDLLKLKDFISSLTNVQKVELLPYHNMGEYKWESMGFVYPLKNVRPADHNDIQRAKRILDL